MKLGNINDSTGKQLIVYVDADWAEIQLTENQIPDIVLNILALPLDGQAENKHR